MRQRDSFWCGAVLSALAVFVCLRSIQEPLYAGIGGGLCALAAAVLFGCGLRADTREKSHAAALEQIQAEIAAVTGELKTLRGEIAAESQSRSKAAAELLEDVRSGFASGRTQTGESVKAVCVSMLALQSDLRQVLERQSGQAENYYKFMIAQPWNEIKALSETLQSAADQIGDIWSSVDSIHSDTGRQMKKVLDQLTEDSEALREKLQGVCETLERQSRETTEAMDRVMQSYSDITAQDMEVLTALAREEGL